MQNVLQEPSSDHSSLAAGVRQICVYVLKLCILEKQTFLAYFEVRHPQQALETLIKHFGSMLYDRLRPLIVQIDSMDQLREVADALQLDVLQPHTTSGGDHGGGHLVALLSIILRLYQDVQERLIFR